MTFANLLFSRIEVNLVPSYSRWKFEFQSGGKPNLLAVSGSLKRLWIDPTALISIFNFALILI